MKTFFTLIGCAIIVLNANSQLLTANIAVTNTACYGPNGSVSVTASGGTAPYQYKLNNGAYQNNNSFGNLWPGYYLVKVKDDSGDTTLVNAVVTGPAAPMMATAIPTPDTSADYPNGSISVYAAGGTPPYSYNWIGPGTSTISRLEPGNYCVTITDAVGCQFDTCIDIITGSIPFSAWAEVKDATCHFSTNGAITVTTIGGYSPFQYKLNNGNYQSTNIFSNLSPGLYTITVKDSLNQTITTAAGIISHNPMFINAGVSPASTTTSQDGFILSSVINGVSPYSFIWSNTEPVQNIFNLQHGAYTVTVTDAPGCTATATFTVGVDDLPFFVYADVTQVRCYSGTNGAVNLTVEGHDAPYSYEWSTGAITEDINNLPEGMYQVTITGINNFTFIDSIYISEPSDIFTSGLIANVSCSGAQNGIVDITPYGGTPPYNYDWNATGDTTQDIFNLGGGAYFVTVLDSRNCPTVSVYIVSEPNALSLVETSPTINCALSTTGPVAVAVYGGVKPYYYNWGNNNTDSLITGPPCSYHLQVTDSNRCTASITFGVDAVGFSIIADSAGICPGGSYTFRGNTYSIAGTYADTANTIACGCDTLYTLDLTSGSYVTSTIYDTVTDVQQYNFGGQIITQSGTYYDTLPAFTACDSIIELHLTMLYTIGINDVGSADIKVYPNPAKDMVRVVTELSGSYTYEIFNIQGALVRQGTVGQAAFNLNVAELNVGVYLLKLSAGEQSLQVKLMKE